MKNIQIGFLFLLIICSIWSCTNEGSEKKLAIIGEKTASLAAITKIKDKYTVATGVKIETFPFEFATLSEKSNSDLANGTAKYDIIMQYNFSLSSFTRNKYIYSLDELKKDQPDSIFKFEADLFPQSWQEVGYYYLPGPAGNKSAKPVAYPFAANSMLMAYNKQLFEDAGNKARYFKKYNDSLAVPTTWEQLHHVAEFFTNKSKNTYGICIEGASTGELYYEFMNYLFSIGNGTMKKERGWEGDTDTKVIVNTAANLNALKFYLSLKHFNKGDYFNVDQPLQAKLLKEGNVALAIMWSDLIYPQIYMNEGKADLRYGYAPIPGDKSIIGGGAFYINRNSAVPEEAFKVVTWLLNDSNQVELMKNGLCSPRRSIYEREEVQQIPYVNALKNSLNRGVYMAEAGPDADKISQIITNYVQRAWRGEIDAQTALVKMQEEIVVARQQIFKTVK